MNKKTIIIILAFILIAYVLNNYIVKKSMISTKNYNINDFADAMQKVKSTGKYSTDVLRNVEKIFRLETAHFTSTAYKRTGAGGLEIHGTAPSYGWKTGTEYLKSVFLYTTPENKTGVVKTFIGFNYIEDSICFLAEYVSKYSPARWYSTDPAAQKVYQKSLDGIVARFV